MKDDQQDGTTDRSVTIRALDHRDWPAVEAIYAIGIATGDATFETEPPSWKQFDSSKLPAHRWVAVDSTNTVLGWVAVSAVSGRKAYRGVVEHSLYVSPDVRGRGVGSGLLAALIESTEAGGIWTIQSGVFPENKRSLALHQRFRFRTIGTRERVGEHHGRWRDVVLIERRSNTIGR